MSKLKIFGFILLAAGLFWLNGRPVEDDGRYDADEQAIQTTIETYFSLSCDTFYNLHTANLESVCDMRSIQNQNKEMVMKEEIEKLSYSVAQGYWVDTRVRCEYTVEVLSTEINLDKAVAYVNLQPAKEGSGYPMFLTFGENEFTLREIDDKWYIVQHSYPGDALYEHSTTDVYEFNTQKLHDAVDISYGVTPESALQEGETEGEA